MVRGNSPGGSTLATQIEKYRHSPGGRTSSVSEKLRQMATASLRAYMNGQDTLATRQQIVVDYLNTMPLSATPELGEVFGLGDGLWAWYGVPLDAVSALLRGRVGQADLLRQGRAYRQVLSLLVAQRRPSGLLGGDRKRLADLTDSYLRLLAQEGMIGDELRDAALAVRGLPDDSA
jgi:membrane peptidoglycan carboxypeptidase